MPETDYATADLTARDNDWALAGDALPPRPPRARLTRAAVALVAVLIAALGFIGGVEMQKQQGSTGITANAAAPGGFQRGASGPGFGAPGGDANFTVGTVSNKKGGVLYVKDSNGTLIKVKTTSTSTVNRTAKASTGAIHPGDTVVIQGSTSKGGTVTASRITATSSTAASGRAGFPGGGAPPGAATAGKAGG
jgi:hypothetical protein